MSLDPERPSLYMAFNNLDLLDENGTSNPYAAGENFFDESLDDATLDEIYSGATHEELADLTTGFFYERFGSFRSTLQDRRRHEMPLGLLPEDQKYAVAELVARALPYLAMHVARKHNLPTDEASLLDRLQNGAVYLAHAAGKYDPDQQASFIGMFVTMLEKNILRFEQGGIDVTTTNEIAQGDLMRLPSTKVGYYRLKTFQRWKSHRFKRELGMDEITGLGNFMPAEIKEYEDLHVEHIPLHHAEHIERTTGVAASDAFIDRDPAIDPYEVVARKVAHDGITAALNLLTVTDSEALVIKAGLHGDAPETSYDAMAEELGITRGALAARLFHGRAKLRGTAGIEEVIQGTAVLPGPESASQKFQIPELKPFEGSPFVKSIRGLLNDREEGSIVRELKDRGISLREILREAQLHPKYAADKVKGKVFMDDDEAERLIEAVGNFSQQLCLSLYELAPTRSGDLDAIFAMLEERGAAEL